NRVIIDHISEYLFAPAENARRNLEREGVRGQIHVVGNTIVDAVQQHYDLALRRSDVLERWGYQPHRYIFMTVHREENTDYRENLTQVLEMVRLITRELGLPVVFPAHPRTPKRLAQFGLEGVVHSIQGLRVTEALGYLDALRLMGSAALVMTDSGGVQQEACILRVPCVTLRDTTEWVETVAVGANVVTGVDPARVLEAARSMVGRQPAWKQPFGDGETGRRIASVVKEALEQGVAVPPLLGGIGG
ncbi:MAG: UDP-N-acetylglucosamine 2-epimerase, partial [Chloroflexi bacterium]|nr:UDP-N-acetylglucosamine 2-epimerase [Chloroflexota bacterium]